MSVAYERGTGHPNLLIVNHSHRLEIPTVSMQEKHRIKLFIRIPQDEYPEKANSGEKLIHFGLPI